MGSLPRFRAIVRQLPFAIVCTLIAWPIVLWLVHVGDPEGAVALARGTASGAWSVLWWSGGALLVACVVFPPALAWLRLAWHDTWIGLTSDASALARAQAELRHFETPARQLEVGRLARLRRQWQLAATHLERAVELDGSQANAWHQLGLVRFVHMQWPAAAAAFERAEELDPGHAFGDALLHLGRVRFLTGEASALATLLVHQRRHGGGKKSHVWLADAQRAAGDAAGAIVSLRHAAARGERRLSAEENWYRAVARVRLWGKGGRA
jgi:tetratricopeptide (TPR) repeat protein